MTGASGVVPGPAGLSRRRVGAEVAIVLGLSLGQSAVYAIVTLLNRLTLETPLSEQVATLNPDRDEREIFNLVYQLLSIGFSLVPVALACFLLWRPERPRLARLGIDGSRPLRDTAWGAGLALVIGLPGIGVYLAGRALGLGVTVNPAALGEYWWTVPVLLLSALRAGLEEEIIVLGYLFARLRDLGTGRWTIIVVAAVFRGTYHLYQGVGAFAGNVAMGLLFGWLYSRTGRVLPFVIAHVLIDAAIFVGYPWAVAGFPGVF